MLNWTLEDLTLAESVLENQPFTGSNFTISNNVFVPQHNYRVIVNAKGSASDTEGNTDQRDFTVLNLCTITFNANGGTTNQPFRNIGKGSAIGSLPTLSRTGYTFNGWWSTSASSGGTKISATTTFNANATIYARWTQLYLRTSGNMSMPPEGASNIPVDVISNVAWGVFVNNDWLSVTSGSGSGNGTFYITAGANLGNNERTGSVTVIGHGIRITVQISQLPHSPSNYIITYNSGNAGGIAPLSQTVPAGDGVTLQANRFVLLGSKFIGWSTAKTTSNSTVVMYLPNQYIVPKGGMTLYPVWGPPSGTYLTVSYDANGGTGTPLPSQSIPANAPVNYGIRLHDNMFNRPGYVFLGWDENPKSTTADFSAGEIIIPTDSLELYVKLYAIWG